MNQGEGIICLISSTLDISSFFTLAEEQTCVLLFYLDGTFPPVHRHKYLFVQRSISIILWLRKQICYGVKLGIDFIIHYIFCMPETFHNKDGTN